MKFYGNGIVWDAENNKALCRFVNGEIETSDERVKNKLAALGYPHDGPLIDATACGDAEPRFVIALEDVSGDGGAIKSPDDISKVELLAALDLLQIPYTSTDKRSKTRLIELLGGAKNGESA